MGLPEIDGVTTAWIDSEIESIVFSNGSTILGTRADGSIQRIAHFDSGKASITQAQACKIAQERVAEVMAYKKDNKIGKSDMITESELHTLLDTTSVDALGQEKVDYQNIINTILNPHIQVDVD